MQHHAADQLDVERPEAEDALGGLADGGESGDEEIVEGSALGELLAEFVRSGAERLVGQGRELRLERVYRLDLGPVVLQAAVVGGTKNTGKGAKHQSLVN